MGRIFYHDRLSALLCVALLIVCAVRFSTQRVGDELYRVRTARVPEASTSLQAEEETIWPDSLLPGERINLNTASAMDLTRLPQIGTARAQAIVDWREENGGFQAPEDLMQVYGIGEGIFGQIQNYITVEHTD